jgi:AraC family transcriptional regulator of adaptative response/methylated-DNA-[protein]-cysteine methyltransferase
VEAAKGTRLRDRDLRAMSVDPIRARRYFKRHYGMTFQAYDRARRMGMAMAAIRRGAKLGDVGFGFESQSGFRDAFRRTFGTTPGKSRGGDCIVTTVLESPVGPLIACATSEAVCLLEFGDRRAVETQVATLRSRFERAIVPGRNEHLERLKAELRGYFAGELKEFSVPIAHPGTPFQEAVWRRLLSIPYGETLSYAQLAIDVGRAGAQRAVGTANGKNRIAIIIPCHRVVNKSGKLGGYGGGLWRKQFLLNLERGESGLFG